MANLKISQLPIVVPPLAATDLFPASQQIGTPSAQTRKVPWGNILSQIQSSSFPYISISGISGAANATRIAGATTAGAPSTGTFITGDLVTDLSGGIWQCTAGGSPGTWVAVGRNQNLVTSVFGRLAAVTAQSGDYTAAQVTNAADKSSASTQTFTGIVRAPYGLFGVAPNVYTASQSASSFLVVNPSTPAQQLILAWDSTNQISYLQSITQGVSVKPLILNPSAGAVGIGYAVNHAFTRGFEVAGTALFDSNVLFNNGITVAEAGGGIQFNDSGGMTVNDGISFYTGNQYYRIGFDDNSGTAGWIRSNVDLANSSHGFIWSAGLVTNPINALMYLRGDGKLMLSASANSASFQSFANIYGDLFLGNQTTPSNPTAGMKVYPKSDGKLYALNSSGTEYDLTNSGAGSVTSVFGRTGAVVGVATDYASVTQFTAKSFLAQVDGTYSGAGYQFMVKGNTQPGYQLWMGYDTTNKFGYIQAVDISGSPTGVPLLLNPNFSGSSAAGNVGINTNSPTAQLHVIGGCIFDKGAATLAIQALGRSNFIADGTASGNTPQIRIQGSTVSTYETHLGYDTTNNFSYVQSVNQGVALTPFKMNPGGGDTFIGNGQTTGRLTLGISDSFTLPADMALWDCNITRTGTSGGPYSLLFRVKCDDGFVHVGTVSLL